MLNTCRALSFSFFSVQVALILLLLGNCLVGVNYIVVMHYLARGDAQAKPMLWPYRIGKRAHLAKGATPQRVNRRLKGPKTHKTQLTTDCLFQTCPWGLDGHPHIVRSL